MEAIVIKPAGSFPAPTPGKGMVRGLSILDAFARDAEPCGRDSRA